MTDNKAPSGDEKETKRLITIREAEALYLVDECIADNKELIMSKTRSIILVNMREDGESDVKLIYETNSANEQAVMESMRATISDDWNPTREIPVILGSGKPEIFVLRSLPWAPPK